jgi:ATP-dependent Clp protease ATP-binding subunit ClpC
LLSSVYLQYYISMQLLKLFINWYLFKVPEFIFHLLSNFTWFFFNYFSVLRHLRSLFSPWKRIYEKKESVGFNISEILNRLTFNTISRGMGFMVRLSTILVGCITIILNFIFWMLVLILWAMGLFLMPVLYVLFIPLYKDPGTRLNATTSSFNDIVKILYQSKDIKTVFKRLGLTDTELDHLLKLIPSLWRQTDKNEIEKLADFRDFRMAKLRLAELLFNTPASCEYFKQFKVMSEDIEAVFEWQQRVAQENMENSRFWERENLSKIKAVGKDWAYGYTPTLDRYAQNLNSEEIFEHRKNVHKNTIERIEQIFSKERKTNILLIGKSGVGKKSLCHFLAKKIIDGKTTAELADHRVMSLDLSKIVSAKKTPAEREGLLAEILSEASSAGNIIVVFDNFNHYLTDNSEADLSIIITKALRNLRIKLIGICSDIGFRQQITSNKPIYGLMEVIELNPTDKKQTLKILETIVPHYEKRGVFIEYFALKEIINKADDLIVNTPFPDKAVDLLDEATSSLTKDDEGRVTQKTVDSLLSKKTGMEVGVLSQSYKEKLLNLEQCLHEKIVGQDQAITVIAQAIRRASLKLEVKDKPVATLFFLGPTGVGKTETAKALAQLYFGSRENLIRVDFGQYTEEESLRNLIGAPPGASGFETGGQLTEAVRQKPHAVVLFDEIEKAHPKILNALLPLFDEGYLTDARGDTVSFKHTIIISTSNAATDFIYELLVKQQKKQLEAKQEVLNYLIKNNIFLPEFLNRFDGVILYTPLNISEIRKIAILKLESVKNTARDEHGITLKITEPFLNRLCELGYNQEFGARFMERTINEYVLDTIAKELLEGKVNTGEELVLS